MDLKDGLYSFEILQANIQTEVRTYSLTSGSTLEFNIIAREQDQKIVFATNAVGLMVSFISEDYSLDRILGLVGWEYPLSAIPILYPNSKNMYPGGPATLPGADLRTEGFHVFFDETAVVMPDPQGQPINTYENMVYFSSNDVYYVTAPFKAKFNNIEEFQIHCSLCTDGIKPPNRTGSTVIGTMLVDAPPGAQLKTTPMKEQRSTLETTLRGYINQIEVWITDSLGNQVNFNGEPVIVEIRISYYI